MTVFGVLLDDPWYLLGLLLIPLLVFRLVITPRIGRVPTPVGQYVRGTASTRASLWWVPDALRMLGVAALVIALTNPHIQGDEVVHGEGVDIMLAVDMSGSMNAIDMSKQQLVATLSEGERPKNRFEVAREILKQFIAHRNKREHDRIGLVIFGEKAWLKYPLTHDHARLIQSLNQLVLDDGLGGREGRCRNGCTIAGAGTAIGDALGRAYNQLRRSNGESKIILLITDGKQQGGSLDADAIARHIHSLPDDERVRVYSFLVGGQDQVWLPEMNRFGQQLVDRKGLPSYQPPRQPFETDPALLRRVAGHKQVSDGSANWIEDPRFGDFYESYDEEAFRTHIADLERTVFTTELERPRHPVFFIPLLIALLLLLAEWTLRFTVFRGVV